MAYIVKNAGAIMSVKFAFIGAGSLGFTRGLARDLLSFPAFADATICLMDIDKERLEFSKTAVERIIAEGKYPAKLETTTSRSKALKGADGVLITILQGGPQVFRTDIEIPKKYGVDINVGDTRALRIFRMLRTLPVMLDICADVRKLCPGPSCSLHQPDGHALPRNAERVPGAHVTGLCHSVQAPPRCSPSGSAPRWRDYLPLRGINTRPSTWTTSGRARTLSADPQGRSREGGDIQGRARSHEMFWPSTTT
jgi:hypothetical protein